MITCETSHLYVWSNLDQAIEKKKDMVEKKKKAIAIFLARWSQATQEQVSLFGQQEQNFVGKRYIIILT